MEITITIVGRHLKLAIGEWHILDFEVNDRTNYDGGKRNRNTAIYRTVNDWKQERFLGRNMSVKDAILELNLLGVDVIESGFIALCENRGWGLEIPPQYIPGQKPLL